MAAALPEGQDWANYQVAAPSTAGLTFVFVKATEGTGYVNPKHSVQVAHVREGGLVVGHYHFQRPGSPQAQAAYFLRHAQPAPGDVLACDWEDTGVSCEDKDAFIRAVQEAEPDLRTVLYCNRDFWLHRDTTSFVGDGLWIADPSAPKGAPRVDHPWLFHQYGSPGGLDRNVSRLSATDLRAWAAGTTITPQQQQEDDVSWNDKLTAEPGVWTKEKVTTTAGQWLVQTNLKAEVIAAGVKALTAQVAALTATVGVLAKGGGLTAAEITAAATAGATAALAELGDALTKES